MLARALPLHFWQSEPTMHLWRGCLVLMFQSNPHGEPVERECAAPKLIPVTPQPTWITASNRALDQDGPARPFQQLNSGFIERPIFVSFREVAERCPNAVAVQD